MDAGDTLEPDDPGRPVDPVDPVEPDAGGIPALEESARPWQLAFRRFRRNRLAAAALVLVVLIVLIALGAPLIERYPSDQIGATPLQGPTSAHWFGTDALGRDIWSRVVNGARLSLFVGVGSQLIAISLGMLVGSIAGYRGGWIDALLMRLTDITLSIPALLLALLFLAVLGSSTLVVVLAIGLGTWPISARLVRSQVLQIRSTAYVEAARIIGCRPARVLFVHVLRNVLGPGARAGDVRHPAGDHHRSGAELRRSRPAPTEPELGSPARRLVRFHPHQSALRPVPGDRDVADPADVQLRRRRHP